jgi:hypothetical protein
MIFIIFLSASVLVSILLITFFINYRYIYIKPSIQFILLFNVFLQWPAVFYFDHIATTLNRSLPGFILMFTVVPVVVLLISFFNRKSAKIIYANINNSFKFSNVFKIFLVILIFLGPLIYFQYVSIHDTGLISVLRGDPRYENIVIREKSLKMLPALPRYFHAFSARIFSFFLIMILINELPTITDSVKKSFQILYIVVLSIFTIGFLAIDGSRGPGGLLLMVIFLFLFYKFQFKFKKIGPIKLIGIGSISVSIPMILEYFRSNSDNFANSISAFWERIFFIRLNSGLMNIRYAEKTGNPGISAIGKLAELLGYHSVNFANIVSTFETYSETETGLANASFVMSYYSYFGLYALPICIGLILSLDIIPWFVVRYINPKLYCFAVIAYAMCVYQLIDADFTTIFITHGLVIWMIIFLVLPSRWMGPNLSSGIGTKQTSR